jgi:ABC-type glycerol-3-phosphate transport system substrate-binding protein
MRQQLIRWLALGAMSVIAACGGSQPSTAATAGTPDHAVKVAELTLRKLEKP